VRHQHRDLLAGNEAEIFLKHPDIKGVSFVGSTAIGLHIYQHRRRQRQAGAVLSPKPRTTPWCSRTAALERTARGIVNSSFGCAG
jgi:malonate-semialdehyde dehydrogenase (acetylating)/methylmalonate-semialdehyde dehydrogenase